MFIFTAGDIFGVLVLCVLAGFCAFAYGRDFVEKWLRKKKETNQ